ncbi:MAG: DNA helicase RecQ [Gammaproteobacteria bacterium]|nr:DNA helicase RecQ [Gammaproteobacteria bacterium]
MNHDQLGQAALEILNTVFGYPEFRLNQQEIVTTVARGNDALVLMPTGGGKSLCYQIPALLRKGTAVVVSPLIALMQDQVAVLQANGVRAEFLNSSLSGEQAKRIEDELYSGQIDLLYVAPERLLQPRMLGLLENIDVALFAIDEAHCVSRWGHDFRPEYMQLSVLHERFPAIPRVALTATADERTRQEIISHLALEAAEQFINSFDRPNIQYHISDKKNGKQRLIDFIKHQHAEDSGIVYCLSRKRVESFTEALRDQGFNAYAYHAGMSSELRKRNQEKFLNEEGVIMVATIAFGMGIDKPNVRFVAHMDLPKSIEAYYQQTGRAGRDGLPSTAWMIYGLQDVIQLNQWIQQGDAPENVKRIETEKLNALLGLCETIECRRHRLLEYFGEQPHSEKCGNCDNCLIPPVTWDATEAARKALSCIHKTGNRFGTGYVVDVLCGTENERVIKNRHNDLSVFGIGNDLSKVAWGAIIRQLVTSRLVQVDVENYNVLRLTEKCRPLLQGAVEFHLRELPKKTQPQKRKAKAQFVQPQDEELYELLKAERMSLASEYGVPPYIIFGDKTLMAMAEHRPLSDEDMLAVSGVGQFKLDKYGMNFLELIEEYCAAHG